MCGFELGVCVFLSVHLALGKTLMPMRRVLARTVVERASNIPMRLRATEAHITLWTWNQASGILGHHSLSGVLHPNQLVRARATTGNSVSSASGWVRITYQTMHRGSYETRIISNNPTSL